MQNFTSTHDECSAWVVFKETVTHEGVLMVIGLNRLRCAGLPHATAAGQRASWVALKRSLTPTFVRWSKYFLLGANYHGNTLLRPADTCEMMHNKTPLSCMFYVPNFQHAIYLELQFPAFRIVDIFIKVSQVFISSYYWHFLAIYSFIYFFITELYGMHVYYRSWCRGGAQEGKEILEAW